MLKHNDDVIICKTLKVNNKVDLCSDVEIHGNLKIDGTLHVIGKSDLDGGVDPPYISFLYITEKEIIDIVDKIENKNQIFMFFDKDEKILKIYIPNEHKFIKIGETQ